VRGTSSGDGSRLARIVNGTLTTHTLDVGLGLPEVIVEHDDGDVTRYLHLPHSNATDGGAAWSYSAAGPLRCRSGMLAQTAWAACGSAWMAAGRWQV
jgi:hypothetical protein